MMAGYLKEVLDKGLESGTASYLGISPEDIDWASSIGAKYKLAPGKTDAARHVALGWLASKSKNPEAAKFLADLREYSPLAGGIPSRKMDLENNAIGFSLPAESKETAEELILKLIESQQVNVDDPQNYAEGGEVAEEKTYEYGFGPEASGIGQLVSPLMPFRREVEQPYSDEFIESADPTQMERVVTPGQYGNVEPAVPEALQGLASFKGLLRDPEARQAVMDALASTPDALQGLVRRMGISGEAALAGEQQVYDPKTNQVIGAEEIMLAAPTMMAPATAISAANETGTLLGMMGGNKASGRFKEAVDSAEEMFAKGRREDAIYRKTGVIRAEENKPAVFIPIHGDGGLDVSSFDKFAQDDLIRAIATEGEPSRTLGELISFPNGFEAYPELADKKVLFWPFDSPIFDLSKGSGYGDNPVLYNPTVDAFVVSTNYRTGRLSGAADYSLDRALAPAIQDYISQKEGFVRPKSTDLSEVPSTAVVQSRDRSREIMDEAGAYGQIPSPRATFEAAQAGYLYDIDRGTRSPLGEARQSAFNSYGMSDPERYMERTFNAYGPQELSTYPVNMGPLRGDLPNVERPPVTYESPLFDVVRSMKQEKGRGDQILAQIQKSGVKQEDLEYMGLEPFLRGRKSVTKQDILDHMEDRKVVVQDQLVPDFYRHSFLVSKGPDGESLAPEARPRGNNAIALTVPTDPISGVAATKQTAHLHDGLPDNTVVHARFNNRTVRVNDKPVDVLFVDEIQSDWHQAAKQRIRDRKGVEVLQPGVRKQAIRKSYDVLLPRLRNYYVNDIGLTEQEADTALRVYERRRDQGRMIRGADERVPEGFREQQNDLVDAIYKELEQNGAETGTEITPEALKREAYSAKAAGSVPDAPFKDNWHELAFRRLVQEAVDGGLSGVAFTPDYLQNLKYPGKNFKFYDTILKKYAEKYAKRHGAKLGTAKLPFEKEGGMDVWYMPITKEMEDLYGKPIPQYANGGGVAALAPRAKAMFNTPDIRRGVAAFAPYTTRRA